MMAPHFGTCLSEAVDFSDTVTAELASTSSFAKSLHLEGPRAVSQAPSHAVRGGHHRGDEVPKKARGPPA